MPAGTASVANGQVSQPFTLALPAASGIVRVGVTSSVESGSPEHAVAVGPGTAACSGAQCAFHLTLPWGPQILTVTTYGAKTVQTKLHVALGGTRIALAAGGTIAQISLDLQDEVLSSNTAATTNLYVTARDTSGNTIVGAYGEPITLASNDTAGATKLGTATVSASTDSPVSVAYTGATEAAAGVTFTASATGVPVSAITSATLTFTAAQVMYVADQTGVGVFARTDTLGNVPPLRHFNTVGYTPFEAIPDGRGNLLLLVTPQGNTISTTGLFNSSFLLVPINASGSVSNPTPFGLALPSGQVPLDAAIDTNDNVYVLSQDANGTVAISVFAPGATSASRVIAGATTQLGAGGMNGIAVANDGSIAVNMTSPNGFQRGVSLPASVLIFAPGATGNVAPQRVLAGSATGLTSWGIFLGEAYLAFLPDGSLAVANMDVNNATSLLVFGPGASGNVAPARTIAGGATGINVDSSWVFGGKPTRATEYGMNGLAADSAGRLYVAVFGSSLGLPSQLVRFDATANGNVVPSAVLAGNFTNIAGPGKVTFANEVVAAPVQPTPSVSGDFLSVAPNRGWNYSVVPHGTSQTAPDPPLTITLYADPQAQGSDTVLVAFQETGTVAAATAGAIGGYASVNSTQGGYTATGYYSTTNFAGGPIPGGLQLVLPSMTQGQSWTPYAGLTANVLAVGTVPGSAACPGGSASVGATVQYSFGYSNERISYVPGCGITSMITDNGTEFTLTSIGSYPQLGELARARRPAALNVISALRNAWKTVFSPWHP